MAAVSVGIVDGVPVVDLDYAEDSTAETDMNVVMNNGGGFIEVQGTAEGHAFRRHELDELLDLAAAACQRLFAAQSEALAAPHAGRGRPGRGDEPRRAALPPRLVLATGNPGKLREMREILAPWSVDVRAAVRLHARSGRRDRAELRRERDPQGAFRCRGRRPAGDRRRFRARGGRARTARPGIYSARYAGPRAPTMRRTTRGCCVELEAVPDDARSARYRCAMVYLRWPARSGAGRRARRAGKAASRALPRGTGGFGYDPLFLVGDGTATAAELDPARKNRVSHRGQALRGAGGGARGAGPAAA